MGNVAIFRDMAAHLRELFERESYSKTTIKDMDFILDSFAAYMEKNNLEQYTPELGESLVKYCREDLRVCPSRVARAEVIVRKLNRL